MEKLYTEKTSKKYPDLRILKYKKNVFFDNLWQKNPELLECRGRVINGVGETIVNPFTKIFNYKENGTSIKEMEPCLAVRKINGFMACVTYVYEYDDVIITTTGSFDSEYVDIARKYIPEEFIEYLKFNKSDYTYIFEIVAEEDKITHPIREHKGAYMIGCRKICSDNPYFSNRFIEESLDRFVEYFNDKYIKDETKKIYRPEFCEMLFGQVLRKTRENMDIEGYVVYGQNSKTVLKVKTPFYQVKKALMRKKDISSLTENNVDKLFYPLVEYCKSDEGFNDKSESEREIIIENYYERLNRNGY